MQLTTIECGAACLAMVLSFHGQRTSVAQCRRLCAAGRGGLDAGTLAEAARGQGLTVRGYRGEPVVLQNATLPAIAHWNGNHFVVIERWGRQTVDIVDPAHGRRRLDVAAAEAALADAVLVMTPGPGFDTSAPAEPSAARVLGRDLLSTKGVRPILAQVLLATLLLQVFGLALPVATKLIVDEVFDTSRVELVALLGAGLAATVLAQVVTMYMRALLLLYLQGTLDSRMLSRFADHLYRLPLRFFHERTTGDIANRLSSIGTLRELVVSQTPAVALDATLIVTYVALMFVFSPLLAAVVAAAVTVQVATTLAVTGRGRDLAMQSIIAQTHVNEYMVQTVSGMATVKATGAEEQAVERATDRILEWSRASLRSNLFSTSLENLGRTLQTLIPLAVLWIGAWLVLDGSLSVGTLLGFTWLASAVLAPVLKLLSNWQRFKAASIQLELLGDILRAEPERSGGALPRAGIAAALELDQVEFSYDLRGAPIVSSVSVRIDPGQRVAIVGHSGAGKTTLVMILLGLYHPTRGDIRYDGVSIGELDPRALRRRMGAVLQEPFALKATVRENITLAHPGATDDDVVRAARIAEIHDTVMALPQGYDTELAERGIGLSGGQLQRLAIARALVGRPSLLVLDEATSHLDSETERRIVANLRDVACTQVVIAHRLSTVEDADNILVMQDGRIVEAGRHNELVGNRATYAALVGAQISTPAAQDAEG